MDEGKFSHSSACVNIVKPPAVNYFFNFPLGKMKILLQLKPGIWVTLLEHQPNASSVKQNSRGQ